MESAQQGSGPVASATDGVAVVTCTSASSIFVAVEGVTENVGASVTTAGASVVGTSVSGTSVVGAGVGATVVGAAVVGASVVGEKVGVDVSPLSVGGGVVGGCDVGLGVGLGVSCGTTTGAGSVSSGLFDASSGGVTSSGLFAGARFVLSIQITQHPLVLPAAMVGSQTCAPIKDLSKVPIQQSEDFEGVDEDDDSGGGTLEMDDES